MPKIIQLDQHVADLIAAGEVVSRPASVVKELAENSIDAGAGIITIQIASGGMTYIRVTDNGHGIAPDDVKTAFLRHATSKLKDASGLDAIETLGFRGEALAAIAAVSRIELLTRTADSATGTRLFLEAGRPQDPVAAGAPVGTTIIVRDLFFNTPARLKFMKTDRAEGAAVSSAAQRIALSRPDISLRYIKDGKTEFHTPGDSRPDSCVYSLLGREIEAGFIPVEYSDESVSIKGYVSGPGAVRGNRSYQFFFVNGRVVRSMLLQSALEQAYKNMLHPGRFPACVLYITTGANNVDVNVHPAKTEVRFISDKQIFDGVYYASLGALEQNAAALAETAQLPAAQAQISPHSGAAAAGSLKNYHTKTPRASYVSDSSPGYAPLRAQSQSAQQTQPGYAQPPGKLSGEPAGTGVLRTASAQPRLRVIGEALGTYIIAEYQQSVWFIDKHAAHERILYNALAGGSYKPMSEALITPVVCRTGTENAQTLLDSAAVLDTLGFSIESFGEDSVAVRHIPADIRQSDVESVLSGMCTQLERGSVPGSGSLDRIYKIFACKAAIKAGSRNDITELEALAARVMTGEISHCPHGRPVAYEVSRSVLEKNLGRA